MLGDSNWTTDEPKAWTLVDSRKTLTKSAWTEKIVTPAKYEKCDTPPTLAYTGLDEDATSLHLGVGVLFVLVGLFLTSLVSRKGRRY